MASCVTQGLRLLLFLLLWVGGSVAQAVPSFARQTGLECTACHLSWLELTSVGRRFKLGGYTLMKPATEGERPWVSFNRDSAAPLVPLAVFVQGAVSRVASTTSPGADASMFPDNNRLTLQQLSVFLAGRIADHAGGFAQWTYDGLAHHSAIDNVDIRWSNRYVGQGLDVVHGISLNNSPTMSDVFNTTPVWGFPFAGSAVAPAPAAATLVEEGLAQQVAGLSVYSLWNNALYAEAGAYRTADGLFSVLRAGVDRQEAAQLSGAAPYWRLALQQEWDDGTHSAMLGAFGLTARKFPDPTQPSGPTDRFHDIGFDAQYQYVTDVHRVGAQWRVINETQSLNGSVAAEAASNLRNSLTTWNSKLTYYFQNKYGVSLGVQRVKGDADAGLYSTGEAVTNSASGSPNSASTVVELNWLPWRDRRFTLQYTAYQRFNGAGTNYDGFGRRASDNNTLYLLAWFPF